MSEMRKRQRRRMRPRRIAAFLLLAAGVVCAATGVLANGADARVENGPLVERVVIDDTVQPVSAARLERAITRANADGAAMLIVELDTPGGLLDSTREMVGAMLRSRVPVAVYIAPEGARGGSAGFFLLEAADVAAMAPGTNAGASHPVVEGAEPDATMRQKMENDAAAFLRSYVSRRGRNVAAAEDAVRNSKSYSAEEALDAHLIDVIAGDDPALLREMDGREVTRMDGSKQRLALAGARVVTLKPTVRERVLDALENPNLALLLLAAGVLLIYVEFHVPGTIVPGALGTVMVLLALFALNMLPVRHAAVALLVAGVVLLALEVKFASHGALAVAGIAALAAGLMTLVDAPVEQLRVRPGVAIGVSAGLGGLTVFLLRLAMRAKRRKALTGVAALVGATGVAMERIGAAAEADERCGRVMVEGEIWEAVAEGGIEAEAAVRVTGADGDRLRVSRV